MDTPIEYQTIDHDGRLAYVLVPVADWARIAPLLPIVHACDGIPRAIIEAHVLRDIPLVRAWREHLGLTQQGVADKAGMAQPALARIERGDSRPRADTQNRLAEALGVTLAQLMAGD